MKIKIPYSLNETVHDLLTRKTVKIVGIQMGFGQVFENNRKTTYMDSGCVGYWVDDPFLDGGRHPWEIDPVGRWKSFKYYLPLSISNLKASFRSFINGDYL